MKIISTFHKLLFFKTIDLYTLDSKIRKKKFSSHETKKISEHGDN